MSGEAREYGKGNDLSLNRYAYVGGDPAVELVPTGCSSYAGSKRTAADPYGIGSVNGFSVDLFAAWGKLAKPYDSPLTQKQTDEFNHTVNDFILANVSNEGPYGEVAAGFLKGLIGGLGDLTTSLDELTSFERTDSEAAVKLLQEAQAAEGTGEIPKFNIGDSQFGAKVKHLRDFGRNPGSATDRAWLRERMQGRVDDPAQVWEGTWNGLGDGLPENRGRGPAFFFESGNDVVVTDAKGNFVTILQDGVRNSSFVGARVIK